MNTAIEKSTSDLAQMRSRSLQNSEGSPKDVIQEKASSMRDDEEADQKANHEFAGQTGVKEMEAMTLVWTKPWLITAYILYVL